MAEQYSFPQHAAPAWPRCSMRWGGHIINSNLEHRHSLGVAVERTRAVAAVAADAPRPQQLDLSPAGSHCQATIGFCHAGEALRGPLHSFCSAVTAAPDTLRCAAASRPCRHRPRRGARALVCHPQCWPAPGGLPCTLPHCRAAGRGGTAPKQHHITCDQPADLQLEHLHTVNCRALQHQLRPQVQQQLSSQCPGQPRSAACCHHMSDASGRIASNSSSWCSRQQAARHHRLVRCGVQPCAAAPEAAPRSRRRSSSSSWQQALRRAASLSSSVSSVQGRLAPVPPCTQAPTTCDRAGASV
jgi:hypothetical protein